MISRLQTLLQLWGLGTSPVVLPLWFLNGLLWSALTWGWLLILCAVVGAAFAATMWFVMFGRDT